MSSEEIIMFFGSLLLGVIKVPFVDWLKKTVGLDGTSALILAYVVAIGVAVAALLVSGELAGGFTLENFLASAATIIATAQFVYRIFNQVPQS